MSDLQPGIGEAQIDCKSNDAIIESWPHLLSPTKSPWVLCSGVCKQVGKILHSNSFETMLREHFA